MACTREHVDGCRFVQRITELGEAQDIARQGCGVAGDIDDALRAHRADRADRFFAHAFSRRINDDHVRPQIAFCQLLCGLARVGAEEFNVFNAVRLRVRAGVLDGFRNDLCADDAPKMPREAKTDRSRSAVEVKGELAASRISDGALIQPLRLRGVDLKEGLRRDGEL